MHYLKFSALLFLGLIFLVSCNSQTSNTESSTPALTSQLLSISAGSDKTITLPLNSVTLTGTQGNVNGTTLLAAWSKISGPSSATISSPSSWSTTISNLTQGTYVFRLTVTDSLGDRWSDDVAVKVEAAPSTVQTGTQITLWKRSSGYDCAVFLPRDYESSPNKQYPMILSLHGFNGSVLDLNHTTVGGNKTGFIKQVWNTPLAATFPAIVIAPNVNPAGRFVNTLWDQAKLRQLILDALSKYRVDPHRVVATGLSAGSLGTSELILNSKDLLAGAMPGAFNADLFVSDPCKLADLPVWAFGNNNDGYFMASSWTSIKPRVESCSNSIHEFTLTVYNNNCGHGCWDNHWAKPEVQDWLVNQTQ